MYDVCKIDFSARIDNKLDNELLSKLYNEEINIKSITKKIHDDKSKIRIFLTTKSNNKYELIYNYINNIQLPEKPINDINISYSYINKFSYSNSIQNINTKLYQFNAKHCFFDGITDFSDAIFEGYINFSYSIFAGNISFNRAIFNNGFYDFRNSIFLYKTSFDRCLFTNGHVSFLKSIFYDNSSFYMTDFGLEELSFRNACFFKNANFEISKLRNSNISFVNTIFKNCKAIFDHAIFGMGDIYFTGCSIKCIIFTNCTFKSYVNLNFKKIESLIIEYCKVEKILYCDLYEDKYIDYQNISFYKTHNMGQIHIRWKNNIISKNGTNAIENYYKGKNLNYIISQYRLLKVNYNQMAYYDDEDEAYLAYMKYKTKNISIIGIRSFIKKMFYKLFNLISSYGTNPAKLLISAIFIIFIFGILFALDAVNIKETFHSVLQQNHYAVNYLGPSLFRNFLRGQYFSTITFLTIGYKEIEPITDITRILAGIEGFIGLFLMSFFTVVVARKILR